MHIDEQLAQAIFESDKLDLPTIRHYIAWVKFRRKIHHGFYNLPHWIQPKPQPKVHWVGR